MLTPRVAHIALVVLILSAAPALADTASYTLNCDGWSVMNSQPGSIAYNASDSIGGGIVIAAGAAFATDAGQGAVGSLTFGQNSVMLNKPCAYTIGSDLSRQFLGTSLSNPQNTGTTLVDIRGAFRATYDVNLSLGSFAAATAGTTFFAFSGASSASESLTIDGAGGQNLTSGLAGLSSTNQSVGNHINKTFFGNFNLQLRFDFGPKRINKLDTLAIDFAAYQPSATAPDQVAGSIGADSSHTFTYTVVSLDPDVVFTPVPEPATGFLTGAGVVALAVSGARRRRV